MKGKIIQIMPAPSNFVAVYSMDGEHVEVNALCVALTDKGEVLPLDIDGSGLVGEFDEVANFEYFKWK